MGVKTPIYRALDIFSDECDLATSNAELRNMLALECPSIEWEVSTVRAGIHDRIEVSGMLHLVFPHLAKEEYGAIRAKALFDALPASPRVVLNRIMGLIVLGLQSFDFPAGLGVTRIHEMDVNYGYAARLSTRWGKR